MGLVGNLTQLTYLRHGAAGTSTGASLAFLARLIMLRCVSVRRITTSLSMLSERLCLDA